MPTGSTVLSTSVLGTQRGKRKKTPSKFKRFHKVFSSTKSLLYHFIQNVYHLLGIFWVFFTEHIALILRLVPKRFYPTLFYPIVDEIVSTTTRVIFTRRKQNRQPVCLKLWQFENPGKHVLVNRNIDYLLEGLEFNKHFAPFVYLGIAPVYIEESPYQPKKILRGKLMEKPKKQDIKRNGKYAIVMRRLNEDFRLDHQIYDQKLSERVDFEFLAREVARMHKELEGSPVNRGTPDSILSKLNLNSQLFAECLQILNESNDFLEKYLWISELMSEANARYTNLFQKRHDDHHIKHCHGDLKTTNLWIKPENSYLFGLIKQPRQLFPIDCIDFNPEFCHIDTLSDLAMLVINLEMYFSTNWLKVNNGSDRQKQEGESLIRYFLDCYLREVPEDREKWNPLLEYYMTEKSMVCTYVSILYDERPIIGKKYLEVALVHAHRLEKMLKESDSSRKTPSLFVPSQVS
jgi:aminoglycoside phosphotransferase family enzyme